MESRNQPFRVRKNGKWQTVYRKNPAYPPWQVLTTVKCKKCGEWFEVSCSLDHICGKQNAYPNLEGYEGA